MLHSQVPGAVVVALTSMHDIHVEDVVSWQVAQSVYHYTQSRGKTLGFAL